LAAGAFEDPLPEPGSSPPNQRPAPRTATAPSKTGNAPRVTNPASCDSDALEGDCASPCRRLRLHMEPVPSSVHIVALRKARRMSQSAHIRAYRRVDMTLPDAAVPRAEMGRMAGSNGLVIGSVKDRGAALEERGFRGLCHPTATGECHREAPAAKRRGPRPRAGWRRR